MIEEREIWACASQLLDRHGADASSQATQRADELLARGELEGHHTFLRILDRIRQLEATAPNGQVQ